MFRSTVSATSVILVLATTFGAANGQRTASPADVNMSSLHLERITDEAQRQVDSGNLVGIVSLVASQR